jgi:hypothetical protein
VVDKARRAPGAAEPNRAAGEGKGACDLEVTGASRRKLRRSQPPPLPRYEVWGAELDSAMVSEITAGCLLDTSSLGG